MSISWLFLFAAIFFGVLGTVSLKLSDGLKKLKPSFCLFLFYCLALIGLTVALQGIDMSIVYGIWSGLGTVLVAILGVLIFQETLSLRKIIALALVVLGVVGIHLANGPF